MVGKIFHTIFRVHETLGDHTMNLVNAEFMAMKMKTTSFSWPFHEFLTKLDFIV